MTAAIMETPTPSSVTTSSAFTADSDSTTSTDSNFHQFLEITLISAQDLAAVSKSMRTYAVVSVDADRKFTSRVDHRGHANPTWNDKFVFRVDSEFLDSDSAAVVVDIYTVSWFRNNLVGTVRVLVNNLIPPFARIGSNFGTRFVALQVRRASGSPQGILNMGVSLVDNAVNANGDPTDENPHQIQLCRSQSEKTDFTFDDYFPIKGGSICNGSTVNESELCSDVGPSASVVAAAIAKGLYQSQAQVAAAAEQKAEARGNSILEDLTMEEATAKGYRSKAERWRTEVPASEKGWNKEDRRHSRRHSDAGLFSCFAYGFEFTIVCGTQNPNRNKNATASTGGGGGDKPSIKRSASSSQHNVYI